MAQPHQLKLGQPVNRRLGDLLVADGLITQEQLDKALVEQKGSAEKLGSILIKLGAVNEEQLIGFLSRQYGVPSITLSQLEIDPDVLKLVPPQIAKKYEVLPVRKMGNSLALAMADPTNVFALDDISFMTNLQVLPLVASQSAIKKAIERNYESKAEAISSMMTEMSTDLSNVEVLEGDEEGAAAKVDVFELKESADEAPVVKLVNMVLVDAIQKSASDIHFESYEKIFRIRFRIDGVLHEMLSPPKRLESAILSRLKIMSNLDIAERRLPQDGRIKLRYSNREIDFRVSTLPTIFGEKAVLRILDKDALRLDLTQLGFDPWSLEKFTAAIHQPYGMVLITGPTGSGKTTTLYSAIHTINSPDVNIMTAEDPVEYNLKGVNQVQINEGVGRTFAAALRSFLRQDPDVILVGEMRDLETISLALTAAETGHLVFGTLHTTDAPQTVDRIIDVFPAHQQQQVRVQLASVLKGVVCQTLLPTKDGKGRVAAREVMVVTPAISNLIREGKTHQIYSAIDTGQKFGMISLDKSLAELVKQGLVTKEDAAAVAHEPSGILGAAS
jgi:type IV pilus assembly protein PilB